MSIFSFLPNADLDSVAQREIKDLNSTRTGSANRVGAWNWQDDIGAWLAGSNKEAVLQRAKEIENARLKEIYDAKYKNITPALGHLTPGYQGVEGVSVVDLDSAVARDTQRATALEKLKATNPNVNVNTIAPTASAGTIMGSGVRADQQKQEQKEQKAEQKLEAERMRQHAETQRQFDNNLALRRESLQADITARQDSLDMSRLKLQMDQNRYMYEAETRRQDSREKRTSALVQALAGLGAAFAI